MTILATKTCVTCTKPCYPTERLMVSDLWVHKAGCMKVCLFDPSPALQFQTLQLLAQTS
jgi:hypothetical protein